MTTIEKVTSAYQSESLFDAVSAYYTPKIADSVTEHYGELGIVSSFAPEEMVDDLISKVND